MANPTFLSKSLIFHVIKSNSKRTCQRIEWSKLFDGHLEKLVTENNQKNWKTVARGMRQKFENTIFTAKQCRERWTTCVDPTLNKLPLTEAESLLLFMYHYTYHNKWSLISQHFPKRYSNTLKNNFYSSIRSILRKIGDPDISEVTAQYFLKATYVCILLNKILNFPNLKPGEAVSRHLNSLIKELKITKEVCEVYMIRISKLLASKKEGLKNLAYFQSFDQISQLFDKIASLLKEKLDPSSVSTEETSLQGLENLLQGNNMPFSLKGYIDNSIPFHHTSDITSAGSTFSPCQFIKTVAIERTLPMPDIMLNAFPYRLKEISSKLFQASSSNFKPLHIQGITKQAEPMLNLTNFNI